MIFDGFLTRLGTVMALGARHGKRGFPNEGQGISIPVWGEAEPTETATNTDAPADTRSFDAKVTPLHSNSRTDEPEPDMERTKKQGGANG